MNRDHQRRQRGYCHICPTNITDNHGRRKRTSNLCALCNNACCKQHNMGTICDSCFKEVKSTKISDVSSIDAKPTMVEKFEPLSDKTHFPVVELGQNVSEPSGTESQDDLYVQDTQKTIVGKKRKISKQGVKVRLEILPDGQNFMQVFMAKPFTKAPFRLYGHSLWLSRKLH